MIRDALRHLRASLAFAMRPEDEGGVEAVHEYWRAPGPENDPRGYLRENQTTEKRSQFLVSWIASFLPPDASIFELGCNVGRNLCYLHDAEYKRLHGLEINEGAVAMFRKRHPEVAAATTIHVGAAEDLMPTLDNQAYELSFTMAVLEHIHTDSEWIFEHLARVTKTWLLTIEDETTWSPRHFPRNYRRVFESLGFRQVEQRRPRVATDGLGGGFHARLFTR